MHIIRSLLSLAFPLARSINIQTFSGHINPNSYIVTLKPDVNTPTLLASQPTIIVTQVWDSKLLNGFAGLFSAEIIELIRAHEAVESIAKDGFMRLANSNVPTVAARHVYRTNGDSLHKRKSVSRR